MKRPQFLLATASALAVVWTFSGAAQAQDAETSSASIVDDIIVTARKREESAQDVPVSVSAMGAETMAALQIETVMDVARYTPGFQMQSSFGSFNDRPVIRGASNLLLADGKVGLFIDGVPWFGSLSTLDMESFQRVEVMRGPQSSLYGRGTLSGAINLVTRLPGDAFSARGAVTAGSDGRLDYNISLSGPVDDSLGFVLGVSHSEFDGQYRNEAGLGEMLGARSSDTYNAGLYFHPNDRFEASLRYYGVRSEETQAPLMLQPASANNCFLTTRPYYCGDIRTPTRFAVNTDKVLSPGIFRDTDAIMGSVAYQFGDEGPRLSYMAGWSRTHLETGVDLSYDDRDFFTLGPACAFVPIPNRDCSRSLFNDTRAQDRDSVTQEVRLASSGDRALRWSLGVYSGSDKTTPLKKYLEITEVGPDVLDAIYEVENLAVFGGAEYDFTDRLTVSLEGRWQRDEVTQTAQSYRVSDFFSPAAIAALRSPLPSQVVGADDVRNAVFETFLPRVSLTWKHAPGVNLYAQYSMGNSPGGFNIVTAPVATYDEERLTNFEIGAKTSLFGFRYLNAALFHNVIENQVLSTTFQTLTAAASYMTNVGETEVNGVEIEGLRNLTSNLSLRFAYTYLDTKITQGVDNDEAILHLGIACKGQLPGTTTYFVDLTLPGCRDAGSIVGRRSPLVSEHTGSVGLRYDGATAWSDIDWFASADLTYVGSFYAQVHNLALIPASQRVNLAAGLSRGNLQLMVWGRNVFDDDTATGALRYVDYTAPAVQSPGGDRPRAFGVSAPERRTWGVSLSVRY